MSSSSMRAALLLALGTVAVSACRGEAAPPRSAGEEPPPQDTKLNRTHQEVKTELEHAAEKTRHVVDEVQRDIQHGAGKGADELGIRRNSVGSPPHRGDAGT